MKTDRTSLGRLPYRGFHDRETIDAILDANYVCHIACIVEGSIRCVPTAYGRKDDHIYIHGSVKSTLLQAVAQGAEACITVTRLDGIVLARSLFHSSMNYHSVMLIGQGEEVSDKDEKMEGLRVVTESIWEGRWDEARIPNDGELKATTVIKILIKEGSAKIRTGGAVDNKEDYDLDIWAGVIPVIQSFGSPIADDKLKDGISLPPSITS